MRKILSALVAGSMALSGAANAAVFVYNTSLSGAIEAPPNASPGTGVATITVDTTAHTLRVETNFSGLLGNVTASHIHAVTAAPFTGTAGVATQVPTFVGFPLGNTFGSYDQTFDMTLASSYNPAFITNNGGTPASAEVVLFNALATGQAYLNIHSSMFPGGEIRGFTPEPASLALLALGAVTLLRRR